MNSKVDKLEARRLRSQGMTLQEISERYGVTRERIRQLTLRVVIELGSGKCKECGDVFQLATYGQMFCCKRCRYLHQNKNECACGRRKTRVSATCIDCYNERQRNHEREARVVEMWAEGLSIGQIAEAVGTTKGSMGGKMVKMRRRGLDLPYRRDVFPGGDPAFPDQVPG